MPRKPWLLIAALLLTSAFANAACPTTPTTVTDTLYDPTTGGLASGTVTVTNTMTITSVDGCVVPAYSSKKVTVTNGVLSVALAPNAGSTPTGSYYTVEYHVSSKYFIETWVVPSSGPVTLATVRTLSPPVPTIMIAASQITPPGGCTNGQGLVWNGLNWICSVAGGIQSLNTLTGITQTFATGTTGFDFGISSLGSTHTFNIPTAANGVRGLLSSVDWNTFNNKQAAIAGNNCAANNFGNGINSAGTLLCAQPITALANASHKWLNSVTAGGVFTQTQPDFSDLTGAATSAQLGSGSATSSTFLHGDLTWGALVSGDIPNNAANTTGAARSLLGGSSSLSTVQEASSDLWEVKNGATSEKLRVYRTFTDATHFTGVEMNGNSGLGIPSIGGVKGSATAGAGIGINSNADLYFTVNDVIKWYVQGSSNSDLIAQTDNSVSFGKSGANRASSIYAATDINLESASNGAQWKHAYTTELLTLSTSGTTTDTAANLLPANSIIEAVEVRVTTTITTATNWSVGDATTAARFCAANATLTAGTTSTCTVHVDQTGAAGPRQTAAAKVRITTTGTPGAGAIRITVFYRVFTPPTS